MKYRCENALRNGSASPDPVQTISIQTSGKKDFFLTLSETYSKLIKHLLGLLTVGCAEKTII